MINASGISKYYGDFAAVSDISFSIRDGEITGLLGPNGAGKTTTLRMLTGYLKPDTGTILMGDIRSEDDPLAVKKLIGYLPESAPLYPDMIVLDYLTFIAGIRGVESQERIDEIASLCGINEVMHKNVGELSKGYKQRVGLAQAMIHDPAILILDEPTSGLDPNQIIEIRNLIKEIGRKKTVILSTHILSEVEATCDRVIIISKGKIVADDRTENLQKAAVSGREISLEIDGADFQTIKTALQQLSGIASVTLKSEEPRVTLTAVCAGTADPRPEIFKLAVSSGWILYGLSQEQQSLENVFREVTTGAHTTGGNNEQV
jgi:ABC-2 type transport system ATP-binding protein